MASKVLSIEKLTRRFPSGGGVSEISLEVARGEFLVLLGPSGCGKSTLLRLIAGLDRPDGGTIEMDGGASVTDPVYRDRVAMVFQNFALYPHMSVFQNIAFPLKLRKVPRSEIGRRVAESARKAGLNLDLSRYPRELSGGERQRVALARALVREPDIILMDEALGSLDEQLRAGVRRELKEFQRRTERTFIYVSHDQLEALSLADRMAVMREGQIQQLGTPKEIYDHPASSFVGRFVGEPSMNLLRAEVDRDRLGVSIAGVRLALKPPENLSGAVIIGIRPRDLTLKPCEGWCAIDVEVESVEYTGATSVVRASMAGSEMTGIEVVAQVAERIAPGENRRFYFDPARVHNFEPETGKRI